MQKLRTNFNPRARVGRDDRKSDRRLYRRRFQSTRPRGARHVSKWFHLLSALFQSTRPRGARPRPQRVWYLPWHFNPRARVGRDPRAYHPACARRDFNPRARVGRDARSVPPAAASANFNPRARVGRDGTYRSLAASAVISIHAPAWGATVPVYTGLITAVALYFSRTSFLAVLLQAFFVAKSSV